MLLFEENQFALRAVLFSQPLIGRTTVYSPGARNLNRNRQLMELLPLRLLHACAPEALGCRFLRFQLNYANKCILGLCVCVCAPDLVAPRDWQLTPNMKERSHNL